MTHEEAIKRIGELEAECHQLHRFVAHLASMPSTDENMQSTWCPPEHDDLCDWWREFVDEARKLTGMSYREPEGEKPDDFEE